MKKYMKWLLVFVALLVVSGLTYLSGDSYKSVNNTDDYEEVMEQDTAYLYFGRETCKYCKAFEPLLENAINDTSATVYYYDTDEHNGSEDFQDILDENEVVTVPKLVKLEMGEVVDYVDHTDSQESITTLLTAK